MNRQEISDFPPLGKKLREVVRKIDQNFARFGAISRSNNPPAFEDIDHASSARVSKP
jgi:hypothetical protein